MNFDFSFFSPPRQRKHKNNLEVRFMRKRETFISVKKNSSYQSPNVVDLTFIDHCFFTSNIQCLRVNYLNDPMHFTQSTQITESDVIDIMRAGRYSHLTSFTFRLDGKNRKLTMVIPIGPSLDFLRTLTFTYGSVCD